MNTCTSIIQTCQQWLNDRPKIKEWSWFLALWLGGLLTVSAIAYPIKWIIKSM
jgi:hypothetical protein